MLTLAAPRRYGKSAKFREDGFKALKEGDTILYRDPRYGTFGHTGKVRKVGRLYVFIKPTDHTAPKRIAKNDVVGFWLKGARKRDLQHLTELNP